MTDPARATVTLRERSTRFVELLRTTPALCVCPNFYILAHASGCPFAPQCRYCYLKSSFWNLRNPEAFSNVEKMLEDVRRWIARDDLEAYLLNTGNLSDSLAFEDARPLVGKLVEVFRKHAQGRRHTLLLLTKGGLKECRTLLECEPCDRVVVSFSVNAADAAEEFESGVPSPAERFKAARTLLERGWRVRLRIDPMIAGFDYSETVEEVRRFGPERITMGSLRAEKSLVKFAERGLFDGLAPREGEGPLARYPRETRIAMYRFAVERLRDVAPIGLCEETAEVWDELGLDKDSRCCNCGE